MKKQEFLAVLRDRLRGLPQEDIQRSVDYYSEMIDDRMEDGLREESAVAALGSMDEIVSQILMETSLPKLVKAKVKQKKHLHTWAIVLLVLGSPIWLSLLIAAMAVLLSVYVVIWSVVVSLFAVNVALAACAFAGVVCSVIYMICGHPAAGLAILGAGLACAGLEILFVFACKWSVKGIVSLSKAIWRGLKRCFIGKEGKV